MADKEARAIRFAGIDAPNTTPVPDVYFDVLFPRLGKAPLKVLLYLVRRIFGFKKEGDTVSLSQICSGIQRRDGSILDRGSGLSRHGATAAIRELEEMGVIVATRSLSERGDASTTYYTLRFREQLSVQDLLRQGSPAAPGYRFPGIDSPNTTPVPDIYFDLLLPELGLAEWRVLLYVVRRTLGFKKLSDAISLDQFATGITTHAGVRLDSGTGLSRSNVHEALNRLVMRNVLMRQRVQDAQTGDGVSIYSLAMRADVRAAMGTMLGMAPGPLREGTSDKTMGVLPAHHPGVLGMPYPRVPKPNHQGVLEEHYQGVLPVPHPAAEEQRTDGVGVLPANYPGVLAVPYSGSSQGTTGERATTPPVVPGQTPQKTAQQETDPHKERDTPTPYDAIIAQVAADLGVPEMAAAYAQRVAIHAATLPTPDVYEAIVAAWRLTRTKLAEGSLLRPGAAMAYFFSVLIERTGPGIAITPVPARAAVSPQDAQFLAQVRERTDHMAGQETWQLILQGLSGTMSPANFTRWFARSVLLEANDVLLIVVPDVLQRDWLTKRLRSVIEREAALVGERRPLRVVALADLGRGGE